MKLLIGPGKVQDFFRESTTTLQMEIVVKKNYHPKKITIPSSLETKGMEGLTTPSPTSSDPSGL